MYLHLQRYISDNLLQLQQNTFFIDNINHYEVLLIVYSIIIGKILKETMISPQQVLILDKFLVRLVHADVKPGNILSRNPIIDDNTNLVLIDFGITI